MKLLLQWNITPLIGYTSYFKLYYHFETPLNLSPNLPEFQFEIGQTVTLPFVKASKFGILDLEHDVFTFCNGKQFYKLDNRLSTRINSFDHQTTVFNNYVDSLDCVTEFTIILSRKL